VTPKKKKKKKKEEDEDKGGTDSSSTTTTSSSRSRSKDSPKLRRGEGMSRAIRQWHQVRGAQGAVLDRDYLTDTMECWDWPLHFIDFESAIPALPYSAGRAPFELIAFQFSHHVLHADGVLEHRSEFLHTTPGECPNGAFLNALGRALGPGEDGSRGTVFRWAAHENTVLTALLKEVASDTGCR
jgi:hypothetical protein